MREKISTFLSSGKWKDALKILLALILMGLVLSRTSLAEIIALRQRLSWTFLLASFVMFIAMTLVKTLQYWVLLGRQTSYRKTLKIVIIQNALTNFVANTAGIASYLAMFQMEENIKVRKSGAVFILTKAGDLLCMGLFLLVSASFVWTDVAALHQLVILILVALAAGLTVFWTAVFLRQTFVGFLRRLAQSLRLDRLSLVHRGLLALEALASQDTKTVTQTLISGTALSFLYMLATMAYGYTRVQTFQIPIEFWGIMFIASMMQFVSVIPFQVFGGLGVTEVSLVYLYSLFGFVNEIPAILVGLRVLFYIFNLILLAYIPLDSFFSGERKSAKADLARVDAVSTATRLAPSDIRFMIVGAEKSGTTWLADMLRQHPQVFIPAQKELHYFNRQLDEAPELENYNFTKPLDWYLDFYRPAPPGRKAGEACPAYLWDEAAAERIHGFNPDVRIVMILRDPLERFISAYRYARQRGTVTAADLPTIQKKYKAFLLDRGLYYQQVKRYLDRFPREQVKICWFDDLRRDSRALLLDVEGFLGLTPFVPANVADESNVTAAPRFPMLGRMFASVRLFTRKHRLTWLIEAARILGLADLFTKMREQNRSQPKATRADDNVQFDRAWLRDFYAEDISNLETLLNVDLSKWKA